MSELRTMCIVVEVILTSLLFQARIPNHRAANQSPSPRKVCTLVRIHTSLLLPPLLCLRLFHPRAPCRNRFYFDHDGNGGGKCVYTCTHTQRHAPKGGTSPQVCNKLKTAHKRMPRESPSHVCAREKGPPPPLRNWKKGPPGHLRLENSTTRLWRKKAWMPVI